MPPAQLESLPSFNSSHKYELPAHHLFPPTPSKTTDHFHQIQRQLFALFWRFFHQIITLLPRNLEPRSIDDALVKLYETLYLRSKSPDDWMTIAELVNPGAIVPEQSQLFADGELLGNVIIDCGDNVNRYCSRADFQLIQNALSGTGVDYTIEFVLDEVPNVAGEIGVAHDVPPKPARKTKAAAKSVKGEGKAKAVEEVTEPAEKPGTKVKKVIPAPSKAVAPPPTARPRSISIAAKAGPSTQPAAILPSRQKRGLATAPRRETLNSVIADAECVGQKRQRFTEHDAKEPPAQKKRALRKP